MRVSSREFGFVVLAGLGLALVTSIPYLLGHLLPFPDSRFNENLVFDIDMNAYFAFARQSAAGHWLFYNSMTPEPHAPVFFNLEWLLLGKLAAVMGGSIELAFQVERIGAIFAFCLALYWLSSFLFDAIAMRRIAFAAITLGGGLGWILYLPGVGDLLPERLFLDLSAGVHPFFRMLLAPNSLIGQVLALLVLCFFLRAEARGRLADYLLAAASCLLAGAVRPFEMLYLVAAISLYLLLVAVGKRDAGPASRHALRSLVVCVSIPLFIYYVWLFKFHDVFRWWGIQNVLAPPLPGSLALSLGMASILLIAALGNLVSLKHRPPAHLLIACCFIASLGLLYSFPLMTFSLQFAGTLLVPMVLLGSLGLEPRLVSWLKRGRRARGAIAVVLLLNSLTSLVLLGSYTREVVQGEHRTDSRLIEAYRWLDRNSSDRDVVLASCRVGSQIPRYTRNSSFCGYFFNTVDFRGKRAMVQQFFDAKTNDGYRSKLVRRFRIRYLVFSPRDQSSTAYDPETTPFLRRVYANDLVTVFEVVRHGSVLGGRTDPHAGQP